MSHQEMEVSVILRPVELSDAKALLGLLQVIASETDHIMMDDHVVDIQVEREIITQYQRDEKALMLVAQVDGQLVGVANLIGKRHSTQQHVAEIGVCLIKEYWGFGIGSMLVEALLEYAQAIKLKVIQLEVLSHNQRALALYRKFQFSECGRLSKNLYQRGRYIDTILMEYILPE